jgi:hypothetical protein
VFIKDIAYYLFAPDGKPSKIAPSLNYTNEPHNPTVLPTQTLDQFQFAFLIRHPRRSIPSYYRCTVPPLSEVTGFNHFMPNEAGYDELCRLFDFVLQSGIVASHEIIVVDADDLLRNPEKTVCSFCDRVGIDYQPGMLTWNEEDEKFAATAFEKWKGFHNDALQSSCLKPMAHAHVSYLGTLRADIRTTIG